jgi:hypothetical protein
MAPMSKCLARNNKTAFSEPDIKGIAMKLWQRAALNALLVASIGVALIAGGIQWLFQPSWDTWSLPGMWGMLLLIWAIGFVEAAFFKGAGKLLLSVIAIGLIAFFIYDRLNPDLNWIQILIASVASFFGLWILAEMGKLGYGG